MSGSSGSPGPGQRERLALLVIAALLTAAVLWLRGGLQPQAPLEALARRSPELSVALTNGRPTLVEFYADWCEACRAMAPAMQTLEADYHGRLDVVLLNVDNPRWHPELERFEVNGIPQLELFGGDGTPVGRSIGARSRTDLTALAEALVNGVPLPSLPGVGAVSRLDGAAEIAGAAPATMAGPRSHG
ncbi:MULTISPECIES: thioredoxin domain-containing protein [Aphanothece]|uniref:thioredoxin domain-containing protein n=1 Tax=Aphanothece TaxID=1121 RepID=UPI0039847CCB